VRAVVQRVHSASVAVDGAVVGAVDRGLMILLGVGPQDTEAEALWLANKLAGLRIFADEDGKMNRSLTDLGLGALVVSQFTLYGDVRKGRRPSFVHAAHPSLAEPLYERFCELLEAAGVAPVGRGVFGADMAVSLVNDGPVTLVVDTP
jgi:D-tyrosyl-tRNA(Tyr) deacylase